MEVTTSVRLYNGEIRVKTKEFSPGFYTVKSFTVRSYDRRTQEWVLPVEASAEVIEKFVLIRGNEIDPRIKQIADAHRRLIESKFKGDITEEQLSLIKSTPLKHQRVWLNFAKNFKALANLSEQGTGKSKMALDWLTLKGIDCTLLIAKNSNVYKWCEEIRKHSDFKPVLLKGARSERIDRLERGLEYQDPVIFIVNYEYVDSFLDKLIKVIWGAIILDESTAIKSVRSKRHKAVITLGDRCKHKLILTGTPLVNSPSDAFGQFRFLNSNIFGRNFQAFQQKYCELGGYGGYQVIGYRNLEELQKKIEYFSFRVLKRDCLDLPPKVFEKYDVEAPNDWAKKYDDLVNASLLEVGDRVLDNTLAITKINRCLQFCDGFLYTDSQNGIYTTHDSPKYEELIDFMEDHFSGNNRLIIWAHFKASIRELQTRLINKFPYVKVRSVTGETPVNVRQQLINEFNDDYANDNQNYCLILQTASMMHGIDIRCDTAVYFSLSWSNEEWQQSQDRIHGLNRGRKVPSTYVVLTIPGTIEEVVYRALQRKQAISALILKDATTLGQMMKGTYGRT